MASPPGSAATSPSGPSPLALPRQRPPLALPQTGKRRKPSIASTTSSAHPLRQTSFPPPDSLQTQHTAAEDAALRFSPSQASQGSLDDGFSDSEIVSAISGPAGGDDGSARKRKRGEKRGRGRPPKQAAFRGSSASLINGEDGYSNPPGTKRGGTAGAQSVITADNGDDDEENEDDEDTTAAGRQALYEGTQVDHEVENQQKSMFRQYLEHVDHDIALTDPRLHGKTVRDMGERYDVWNRAKLRTADVRRLVNQTLSQSVPHPVVTVVSSYAKMFAGLLIEDARAVQAEWLAAEQQSVARVGPASNAARLPKHEENDAGRAGNESTRPENLQIEDSTDGLIKREEGSSPAQPGPQSSAGVKLPENAVAVFSGGAEGLSASLEECDRGPLLPDHLREALRRYKKARRGGTVGFTGLSLEGREVAAPRMSGRRLFR